MKTRILPFLLALLPASAGANFFSLNLNPGPGEVDIAACADEKASFRIRFFIGDVSDDGVVTGWSWEILSAENDAAKKLPAISTGSDLADNLSGALANGDLIADDLIVDLSKADGGQFLLRLTLSTEGADPEIREIVEYPVYVDVVGTPDFGIVASLDRESNGDVLLCIGQSVELAPNLIEKPIFAEYAYSWSGPGGFTASTPGIEVGILGRYELTVSNACGSSTRRLDLERRTSFEVEIDASAIKSNGHGVLCEGDAVVLFSSEGEDAQFGPYQYSWEGPGGLPATTPTLTTTSTGLHRLTITNACGAGSDQIQVDDGGLYPNVQGIGVTYPPDLTFRACPAPDGRFAFQVQGTDADLYDYRWLVLPPGAGDYQAIPEATTGALVLPVDEAAHQDGSSYRVLADNNGCRRFIPADASTDPPPQTMNLLVLPPPILSPMLTDAVIDVTATLIYETSILNPFGASTFIQWELEDAIDGGPPILLGTELPADGAGSPISGSVVIARTGKIINWELSVTPNESDGTVSTRLQLTNTASGAADTELAVRVHAYNKDDNNTLLTGLPRSTCAATTEAASIVALPIELLYFRAEAGEAGTLLEWATATELDNDYFTLERSADGRHFDAIAEVDGTGTTYQRSTYDHLDRQAPAGLAYYRLRQTDFDGRFSFSQVVAVDRGPAGAGFRITGAAPSLDQLRIHYYCPENGEVLAALYDNAGRRLYQQALFSKKGANQRILDLAGLPRGLYILQLRQGGQRQSYRFVR